MPLTGDAKTAYQRDYMQGRRSKDVQVAADAVARVIAPRRGRPRKLTDKQADTARAALTLAMRSNKLSLSRVVGKVAEKLDATKPYMLSVEGEKGKRIALDAADNDAQLRACDLAIKLHERAGKIPSASPDDGPKPGNAKVRMVQIAPDGTETWLEIG